MNKNHYLYKNNTMFKLQYINLCITGFGRRYKLQPQVSCRYLKEFKALEFLDKHYEAEHVLPIEDTIESLHAICRRNGGTL